MKTERRFSRGEVIFKQGDEGKSLFQIIEGSVQVIANYAEEDEFPLAVLGVGKIFGEMAVVEDYPRSSTIIAKEDVRLLEITQEDLMSYFKERPEMILKIIKQLGSRIRTMTEDYNEVRNELKAVKNAERRAEEPLLSKVRKALALYSSAIFPSSGNKAESANKANYADVQSVESQREVSATINKDRPSNIEIYRQGTVIFKQGEYARCMYLIYSGSVGIYSKYGTDEQLLLTMLHPGSYFGEMGMVSDDLRSATAIAETEDTCVEIIRPEDLEKMMEESPEKVEAILKHISNRLRVLNGDYLAACRELSDLCGRYQ